ncbi:MAG: PKD domain-containing protein [Actinomycetota bacterium]
MNALLRLSKDRSSLLRLGALSIGIYLVLFALVSLQLGGGGSSANSNPSLGVLGWTKALAPSVAGNTLDQIRNNALPRQSDLQTVVMPQVIERQTLIVPGPSSSSSSSPAAPTTSAPQRGADNGPSAPTVRITDVNPDGPRVGRTTQVRFQGGDLDGIIRAIAVDWGDGKTDWSYLADRCTPRASEPEHSFSPAEHTYEQVGTFQITVTLFSAGSCERGAIQFETDQVDVEVGPFVPAMPEVSP